MERMVVRLLDQGWSRTSITRLNSLRLFQCDIAEVIMSAMLWCVYHEKAGMEDIQGVHGHHNHTTIEDVYFGENISKQTVELPKATHWNSFVYWW